MSHEVAPPLTDLGEMAHEQPFATGIRMLGAPIKFGELRITTLNGLPRVVFFEAPILLPAVGSKPNTDFDEYAGEFNQTVRLFAPRTGVLIIDSSITEILADGTTYIRECTVKAYYNPEEPESGVQFYSPWCQSVSESEQRLNRIWAVSVTAGSLAIVVITLAAASILYQ